MMDLPQHDPIAYIEACADMGDYESALELINALHDDTLSNLEAGRVRALEYLSYQLAGDEAAAAAVLNRLKEDAGECPERAVAAATEFADMDSVEEACELWRKLCQLHPEDASYQYELASLLEDTDQFEEAGTRYEAAARLKPDWAEAWLGMSDCYAEIDQPEAAVEACRRYLELAPNDQQVLIDYGGMLGGLDRFDEAYAAFERAEALGCEEADLYYYWAVIAASRHDRERLERCRETMAQLAPDTWQARLVDAIIAEMDGDVWPGWEACREAFDIAWEEDDESGLESTALVAVRYAVDQEMFDTLEDFIPSIFEARVFAPPVLTALREVFGERSDHAKDFEVCVEGDAPEEEVDAATGGAIESGPPYRFFRTYRVLAESAEQAGHLVREFEERCGSSTIIVHDVQQFPWEGTASCGVWNCSESHYFSANDHVEF